MSTKTTPTRSLALVVLLCGAASCSSSPDTSGGDGTGGATGDRANGVTKGIGGASSGFDAFFPFTLNDGTGGTSGNTAGTAASADAQAADGNGPEHAGRMCLTALGEAPGGYDWNTCCPYEAATAQDWCTHYMAFCKFNYPINSNLSPGAVALKDMADCLARYPPLTVKSRACRSNFLCEDSSLGQATAKACDFPDLNRRKCDGV